VNLREFLHLAARCFSKNRIPYFVTGAVASFIYGEPRLTQDIDIVADIQEKNLPGLLRFFPEDEFYLERLSVERAVRERSQFNIIHPSSGLKIDVIIPKKMNSIDSVLDVAGVSGPRRVWKFRIRPGGHHRQQARILSEGAFREHLRDIAGIIKISGTDLDFDYLAVWMGKKGLRAIWNDFLEKIGKNA